MNQKDRLRIQHDAIIGQAHEINRLRHILWSVDEQCADVVHKGKLNGRESDLSVFARDLQVLIRRG